MPSRQAVFVSLPSGKNAGAPGIHGWADSSDTFALFVIDSIGDSV